MRLWRAIVVAAAATAALASTPAAAQLNARDARIVDVEFNYDNRSFPYTEAAGGGGSAQWRVIRDTGNCCETYVATTPQGRILDFGGNYVNVSDDRGETWHQVRPDANFVGGEGAIVVAHNGDVLGVGWDPYTGDVLLAFKYEAASGKWRYLEMPLHTPFYDREWIGVVPGPFTIDGETVPYVSFVKGGWPSKEHWLYSTDGLTYLSASSKFTDGAAGSEVTTPLRPLADPVFDAIQANGGMGLTPLGGGFALAAPDFPGFPASDQEGVRRFALLDPATLRWSTYRFPGEAPTGLFHTDSRGRLHNVIAKLPGFEEETTDSPGGAEFEYRTSTDGGATWRSVKVALGRGAGDASLGVENIDFRVHAGLGLAAVGVHVHDAGSDTDRDLLFKLDVRGDQPALLRRYEVGLGDVLGGGNVLATGPRFDFESLAFLPDGRVVQSFMDSETGRSPALAVELSDPVPPGFGASPVPTGAVAPPRQGPAGGCGATDRFGPRGRPHGVRLKVRRRGARVAFTGTVLPRHPGHRVRIQRLVGRSWRTFATVRASRQSTFRAVLRVRGTRFRAVAVADAAGHRLGRSRAVTLRRR